jgi:hypothetical protein
MSEPAFFVWLATPRHIFLSEDHNIILQSCKIWVYTSRRSSGVHTYLTHFREEIPIRAKTGGRTLPSTSKRSARIECRGGCVWIAPRQFWGLVRDNIVEYLGEPPLTGKFRGQPADFLVTINHTILSLACPEHRSTVLLSKRHMKRRKPVSS